MSAVGDTLRALLDFGAQAVAIRGAPRATRDIDITVQLDRAQLAEWTRALAEHGLSRRYPDIADELLDTGWCTPRAWRSTW
jgi:hypothetical protein